MIIPESKTIFVGDTIVISQPPFLAQADFPVWMDGLTRLLKEFAGYNIVSGRGGLAKTEDIKFLIKFLKDVNQHVENLGAKNVPPEATQDLANKLLSKFQVSGKQRDLFHVRLRYGLHQYYARRFRPSNVIGQPEIEDEEQ